MSRPSTSEPICSTPRISFCGCKIEIERDDPLADVLGVVADPLEIVAHAHGADDLAQIDRHRLPAGDGQDRFFLDLVLHRVDGRIGGDDVLRQIDVALHERADGVGNLPLRQARPFRRPCG